jgi:thioredoxin 1
MIIMNLSDFQNKITQTNKPVVIDFWAPWCGPCKLTKPILEKLAQEYSGAVDFLSINADESREVLEQFHVSGIPTVMALRDGKIVGRVTGSQNETGYRSMFMALATGSEVKISLTPFDRYLRLGAGALLLLVGLFTGSWLVISLGGLVAFLGIYDRCPIWAKISGLVKSGRTKS